MMEGGVVSTTQTFWVKPGRRLAAAGFFVFLSKENDTAMAQQTVIQMGWFHDSNG